MKVAVKFFARARDLAGTGEVECELPEVARVVELKQHLATRFPALAPVVPSLLVAVGNDYAQDATALAPGSRIACFPTVSGG